MSDNWLLVIPSDPKFVPSEPAQQEAMKQLRSFVPAASSVDVTTSKEIRFIDCGGNWSGVRCPRCDSDVEAWFFAEMTRVFDESRFQGCSAVIPCCGMSILLEDLRFGCPVGFARFMLEAVNPDVPSLSSEQTIALEKTLGCSIKQIWRHI